MNARKKIKPATVRARAKPKVSREALVSLLDKTLRTSEIADSSANGLQVEGAAEITKVGLAVDACLEAYKLAHEKGCQMIIVHHGIIWDGGLKSLTGPLYRQIEFLVKNGISLYASHLPLDLHPALGNNIMIAKALGLKNLQPFGMYKNGFYLGFEGYLPRAGTLKSISEIVRKKFGGPVSSLSFGPQKIWRVAAIAGGGTAALPEAIEKKIDLFVTGEPAHWNHHAALEGKINVIYGGHYHTEKPGVQALGDFIGKRFGIKTEFLDVPTLV
ncbi:MAG: Nif3-like dinuclear metal center hexameric protein [Chitinispirillales bacterium]|jgi:dinuclear metal center YbgI/SA1388 family protein|nr:Nif3-like dinuclear metal center hexameric protein [Chitinispirillales bacterium]